MKQRWTGFLYLVAGSLFLAGCSTVVGSAVRSAPGSFGTSVGTAVGEGVGRAVGERITARIFGGMPGTMTPDIASMYIANLFSVAFHSGSYLIEDPPYAPGDWTRWRLAEDDDESVEIERAFLGRTADSGEWWRVSLTTTDGKETNSMIVEGLFTAGRAELVRLRALLPGNEEPTEMPVREGAYGYIPPTTLTTESIAGATIGSERITVPAGSFQTRHIRYGDPASGSLDWWVADNVPGGLVRYTVHDAEEKAASSIELIGHGKGAKSELGVTL